MKIQQLILTHRAVGKGLDTKRSGFIVGACSPGIDDKTRQALETLCSALGRVVQGAVPPKAAQALQAWRDTLSDPYTVMTEKDVTTVLADCPVVYSYSRIGDELYALVRARYLGLTDERPDRRTGNFLAHALVMSPGDLEFCGYNPLALSRCGVFRDTDDSSTTTLPELTDLRTPAANASTAGVTAAPFRDKLPELTAAVCDIAGAGKGLVACIANWRDGVPLVESLLNLLPPGARCRTTFSTYQTGNLPTSIGGAAPSQATIPRVSIACGKDAINGLGLTDMTYQGQDYCVMNFLDNRFTQIQPKGAYVSLMSAAVNGRREVVDRHHAWTVSLGLTADSAAREGWDTLLSMAEIARLDANPSATGTALAGVVDLVRQPAQAYGALRHLRPQIADLAGRNARPALEATVGGLAALADRAGANAAGATSPELAEHLRELAALTLVALDKGQTLTSDILLRACGGKRSDQLRAVIAKWLAGTASKPALGDSKMTGTPAASSVAGSVSADGASEHRAAFAKLLEETLALPESKPGGEFSRSKLLVEMIRAATAAETVDEVWDRTGEATAQTLFATMSDNAKRDFLTDLQKALPTNGGCPKASIWAGIKLLELTKAQGEQLIAGFERLAVYLGSETADLPRAKLVVEAIERMLADPENNAVSRAEALGRTCRHIKDGPVRDLVWEKYKAHRDQTDGRAVRLRLVAANAAPIFADELYEETVPWGGEPTKVKFQKWCDDLQACKGIPLVDGVRARIVQRAKAEALQLMYMLLTRVPSEKDPTRELMDLQAAVIRLLGLVPGERGERTRVELINAAPNQLPADAKARLEVMRFILELQQASARPGWTMSEFPGADPRWKNVERLSEADRTAAIHWCAGLFGHTGINSSRGAESLISFIRSAGNADMREQDVIAEAARRVGALLKDRDSVTSVNAAMAFADKALEDPREERFWNHLLTRILEDFDHPTIHLLEQHLAGRCCKPTPAYNTAMRELCRAADLRVPAFAQEPKAPGIMRRTLGRLWPFGSKEAGDATS